MNARMALVTLPLREEIRYIDTVICAALNFSRAIIHAFDHMMTTQKTICSCYHTPVSFGQVGGMASPDISADVTALP